MNQRFALHIGLPKCGSTFLQNVFFASHPDIDFLGPFAGRPEFDALWQYFRRTHEGEWDEARMQDLATQAGLYGDAGGRLRVVSRENIGAPDKIPMPVIAERCRDMFPGALILLIVREPVALVESMYLQLAKSFGPAEPYISFEDWWKREFKMGSASLYLGRLRYQYVAELFADRFGKDALCILPFETFAENKSEFFAAVCGFLDVSPLSSDVISGRNGIVNPRVTDVDLRLRRFESGPLRHLVPALRRMVPVGIRRTLKGLAAKPATAGISNSIRNDIRDLFLSENPHFKNDWGIDYEMPPLVQS